MYTITKDWTCLSKQINPALSPLRTLTGKLCPNIKLKVPVLQSWNWKTLENFQTLRKDFSIHALNLKRQKSMQIHETQEMNFKNGYIIHIIYKQLRKDIILWKITENTRKEIPLKCWRHWWEFYHSSKNTRD